MSRDARSILTLAILLLVGVPSTQSLSVVAESPREPPIRVKQKARIEVLFDGEPAPGVMVSVVTNYSSSTIATLTSDSNGDLTLPELPPGDYFISPPLKLGSRLAICVVRCPDLGIEMAVLIPTSLDGPLLVLDRDSLASSEVRMEIRPEPASAQFISSAEQQPIALRVSELRGVVEDQAGALIPGASIDVVVKGSEGKKHAALLSADNAGRFSIHLPEGEYLALISSPGFRVRVVPFTIIATGTAAEIHFTLEVGSVIETITLTEFAPQTQTSEVPPTDLT